MKVKNLIKVLQGVDKELDICLLDMGTDAEGEFSQPLSPGDITVEDGLTQDGEETKILAIAFENKRAPDWMSEPLSKDLKQCNFNGKDIWVLAAEGMEPPVPKTLINHTKNPEDFWSLIFDHKPDEGELFFAVNR